MPKVNVDSGKCTGCGTCAEVCPMNVFEIDKDSKKAVAKKQNECIGCRACEVQCPVSAIKVED